MKQYCGISIKKHYKCCVNQDYKDNNKLIIISGREETDGYVDDVIINAYMLINVFFSICLFHIKSIILLFSLPSIKQLHVNAVLKCILYLIYVISMFELPVRVNSAFSRYSKLLPTDGVVGDYFGHGVSVYDTMAMVGAPGDDDKATDAGITKQFI
jgi:hypothetical protein